MIMCKTTDEIKLPKSKYCEIKENYLKNPKSAYFIYTELHKEYPMDKKIFLQIINQIRDDYGASPYTPTKKTKRQHNPFSYHDKHPNSYTNIEYSK